jgi:hypothetical protein
VEDRVGAGALIGSKYEDQERRQRPPRCWNPLLARGAGHRGQPRGVAPTELFSRIRNIFGGRRGKDGRPNRIPMDIPFVGAGPRACPAVAGFGGRRDKDGRPNHIPMDIPFVGAGPRACPAVAGFGGRRGKDGRPNHIPMDIPFVGAGPRACPAVAGQQGRPPRGTAAARNGGGTI